MNAGPGDRGHRIASSDGGEGRGESSLRVPVRTL
jgi:hypothetical protein